MCLHQEGVIRAGTHTYQLSGLLSVPGPFTLSAPGCIRDLALYRKTKQFLQLSEQLLCGRVCLSLISHTSRTSGLELFLVLVVPGHPRDVLCCSHLQGG